MTKLPAEFAQWVTETLADSRYLLLKGMRDPFTHSWLKLDVPKTGPTVRTHQARVRFYDSTGADHNARQLVTTAQKLAFDRVDNFLERMERV